MNIMSLSQTISIKDSLVYKFNALEVKEIHKIIIERDHLLSENSSYRMELDATGIMLNDYSKIIELKDNEISILKQNLILSGGIISEKDKIISTQKKQIKKLKLSNSLYIGLSAAFLTIIILK